MTSAIARAELLIDTSMGIGKGEQLLVISDKKGLPLAHALMTVSQDRGAVPTILQLLERKIFEMEPPAPVASAMKSATAVIVVLPPEHGCQLWHTHARMKATEAGARIGLVFPPATWNVTKKDILSVKRLTDALAKRLDEAGTARITSPAGTDLRMSLAGRKGWSCVSLLRSPGDTATIPDWGDAEVSPLEGTAEGTLVVDGSMTFIGKLRTPIRMKVSQGSIVDVEGGRQAEKLREILRGGDPTRACIAELGIGTVPRGGLTGHKDDSLLGTAHVALGHNASLGGRIVSDIHLDAVLQRPTIELDGLRIVVDGMPEEFVLTR